MDKQRIYIIIDKYDLSHKVRIFEDPRFKMLKFDEDKLKMTCVVRTEQEKNEYELMKVGKDHAEKDEDE